MTIDVDPIPHTAGYSRYSVKRGRVVLGEVFSCRQSANSPVRWCALSAEGILTPGYALRSMAVERLMMEVQ